jgi:TldD protein
MSHLARTDEIFFQRAGLDRARIERVVADALQGCEDGELFLEYRQSESLALDDGRIKSASFDTTQGFGLRAVSEDAAGYAHASELSEAAIGRAAETVRAVRQGRSGALAEGPVGTNAALYRDGNPLMGPPMEAKVGLLQEIDAYARARDRRVRQVMASLAGEWQAVQIVRAGGLRVADIRPLVRLNVAIVVGEGARQETGSDGAGGRTSYDFYLDPRQWKAQVDEALRQALVNLGSVPAPAGEMAVVLGPGWPGVMLHEAVGHGLEGDFNRKKTSAFSGLMGERVGAKGVTVVDDGTIPDRRGSLTVDDEGTPSRRTVLIEDGILTGYMQDRMNARLMGMKPTGNGRRQGFAHAPMPRMTNTYMLAGPHAPEEIVRSVKRGLYAVNFGGGQVDITSGKFVFSANEAYLIEDGKVGRPVKGATLIGNGPEALKQISMVGSDLKLDHGIGTCGKDGQGVPVGVGQPSLKIDRMTVGGTAA